MRKLLLVLLLFALATASAGDSVVDRARLAAAIVTLDNRPICTAAAFDRVKGGTLYMTAGHCFTKRAYQAVGLSLDGQSVEEAFVLKAGDPSKGEDFGILLLPYAQSELRVPTLKLGSSQRLRLGARLFAITAPYGGPIQFASGELSRKATGEVGVVEDGLVWQDYMLVRMDVAPGASGSAVVSYEQKAVIGILVGIQRSGDLRYTVVLPIEQFRDFLRGKRLELRGIPKPMSNTTRAQ